METLVGGLLTGEDSLISMSNDVSCLYVYDGPMRVFSQNALMPTLQSVKRSDQFSKGKTKRFIIDLFGMKRMWDIGNKQLEDENLDETVGVADLGLVKYLINNKYDEAEKTSLRKSMEEAFEKSMNEEFVVLNKGKSANDIISDTNAMCKFCVKNWIVATGFRGRTMSDLIEHHFRCMQGKQEVKGYIWKHKYNERLKRKQLSKEEVKFDREEYTSRSFRLLSFLKNSERTKLEPRAVFTAGVPWRAFIFVLEQTMLVVNKLDPNSVIWMGSDAKINTTNSRIKEIGMKNQGQTLVTLTGDNSKYNESMCPEVMMVFLRELGIKGPMLEVLDYALWQFSQKSVKPVAPIKKRTGKSTVVIKADSVKECRDAFNEKELELIQGVEWMDDGFVRVRRGMLMGMANNAFTTASTIASSFSFTPEAVYTLQSSDDFVTGSCGRDVQHARQRLEMALKVSKAAGLNVSQKKSFYVEGTTFEFNSMFVRDGKVMANGGNFENMTVPGGLGPSTDLFVVGKQARNSMLRGNLSFSQAMEMCKIGITNVEKVYYGNRKYQELKNEIREKCGEETMSIPESMGGDRKPRPWELPQSFDGIALKEAVNRGHWKAAKYIKSCCSIEFDEEGDQSWDTSKTALVVIRKNETDMRRRTVKTRNPKDKIFNDAMNKAKRMYETVVDRNPLLGLKGKGGRLTVKDLKARKLIDEVEVVKKKKHV
ncbi:putative PB1 protein [Isavirus salaris]|uniref:RNA-directed RNA polymerase catalytic subunit n=2 Tax=Isavirus salaris TaxID=55987 RepID=RDRP_ISAV8|nr:putative PB1 protein [Isavirus salaris]Q8V3T6.1 RecName: Full=RNA-directed RNA polymerase catalytic subunit; AltName: Full=Polymerase basic protein 1; Short=PB1; AltName: Full=Protein 1; Short=P1; AltName: Full=RNA-directed RNA polymerase subunit P1 [Infectious salmon anemia virus isolate 810/9/99]AAL67962.1 putative PB1 protein [Isavirus salaris]ABG81414.1 PB1 [Infectious salmon anemia virus]